MDERNKGMGENPSPAAPAKAKAVRPAPREPKTIRITENRTLAYGAGLITLRKDQRIDDPWVITAVTTHNVQHEVLE